jgi:hypothetical protein
MADAGVITVNVAGGSRRYRPPKTAQEIITSIGAGCLRDEHDFDLVGGDVVAVGDYIFVSTSPGTSLLHTPDI